MEATPQQRRRQKRCGEQRHSNGNGKGILAVTAWYSSIAASVAFFLLHSYILLESGKKILVTSTSSDFITRQRSNHLVLSLSLSLSLFLCTCEDSKKGNGDRAIFSTCHLRVNGTL